MESHNGLFLIPTPDLFGHSFVTARPRERHNCRENRPFSPKYEKKT